MVLVINTVTKKFNIATVYRLGEDEIAIKEFTAPDGFDPSKPELWKVNATGDGLELDIDMELAEAKKAKKERFTVLFEAESMQPVQHNGKLYNGGKESAQALRDYIQVTEEKGGTEFWIWDITNIPVLYTNEEAKLIKLAVTGVAAQLEFKLRLKKNEIEAAATIAQVEAIQW